MSTHEYCGIAMPGNKTATCVLPPKHHGGRHRSFDYKWYPFFYGPTDTGRAYHLILAANWRSGDTLINRFALCGVRITSQCGEEPRLFFNGTTFTKTCRHCQTRFDNHHGVAGDHAGGSHRSA